MAGPELQVRKMESGQGSLCRSILAELPDWFGIPEAVDGYVRDVESMPTFAARSGGEDVGFVAAREHGSWSVEIVVMGVRPPLHRRGVGQALIEAVEIWARNREHRLLTVKTLGPSGASDAYERTRRFYQAMGFLPVEEIPAVWGPANPCLISIKPLR